MRKVVNETMISIEDAGGPGLATVRASRDQRRDSPNT